MMMKREVRVWTRYERVVARKLEYNCLQTALLEKTEDLHPFFYVTDVPIPPAAAEKIFRKFDADGSGFIDINEVRREPQRDFFFWSGGAL